MEYNHEWAERSRRQKILETKWEKPEKCGFELAVPDWCQVIYTQGTRGEDKRVLCEIKLCVLHIRGLGAVN